MNSTAARVVAAAAASGKRVACAESLTAGMVAAEIATVPGASAVLQGGVVAYQNEVKAGVLGVSEELLATAGSVDAHVAEQMASGVRRLLGTDVGVSTTGAAGPEPHDGQPVGTVFIGIATASGVRSQRFRFAGERDSIRRQACTAALDLLEAELVSA
ncbi:MULTISPECIES: CinA family protein [Arthrobacter]|uniref:Nicotinamide-nucleotide amidohydrolase family protein n=1 Tax=Arthrobacter caoxuetaonis TaxID=2886935 RepID=A0A9X1SBB4_9MICC|nr:nicotinamide-nucleotide amidohydrolase family protein [Arthrobacter caoxuetaonis]MCC3283963.1 nicotinamide-nucleotide amidohydrolase family protein [Arthrobacter caoxuetaonis]MCC3297043.1 nicotinamide-nucleotide amidohydrolase family protein [Arthrobacter caoxuetaonis]MCC9193930.1 nicotinamide-nucleotide amidohydrolase family protein [Arthrobacter sp. zg-Y916]USQ58389.1 nicotinamide-nucleotide amidohydrolase family protein [Arthrobacter caoxuetaonis]